MIWNSFGGEPTWKIPLKTLFSETKSKDHEGNKILTLFL